MKKQLGFLMSQAVTALFVIFLFLILSPHAKPADVNEINVCKYLVVTDFSDDPYGIAKQLRAQAKARGFTVVLAVTDVPQADLFKTCVMAGNWWRSDFGGRLAIRVTDAASGELIAEAATGGTAWWSAGRTVRKGVEKIYKQLGYTGFNEKVFEQRMQRVYPTRPKLAITEEEIKRGESRNHVEGIWSDPQDQYRLGIVPAPQGTDADYFAVVLRSNSPIWQPGEIKAEIRSTASPDIYTCTFFLANKKPAGTTLSLDHNSVLRGSLATPAGSIDLLLVRVWPNITGESTRAPSVKSGASGTGFLLSRSGLIGTNWHVIAGAKDVAVSFPGWTSYAKAEIVIRDAVNDLAVLRVTDLGKLATTCPEFPFQLSSSNRVMLGQRVSTIGYPLTSLLGSNPKFSEGVVASTSGFQDDPRSLQISAEVQPGSSGSPLFDSEGNIIGIVVASLDAGKLYRVTNTFPQNVNWAIKSDYLLSLLGMLPAQASVSRKETTFSAEKAAKCVAIVSAW